MINKIINICFTLASGAMLYELALNDTINTPQFIWFFIITIAANFLIWITEICTK